MKIRRVNELFDDADVKAEFGKILNRDAVRDIASTGSPDKEEIFHKLAIGVPVLRKCMSNDDADHMHILEMGMCQFILRNEEYHTSISLNFNSDSISFCIYYQELDYDGDVLLHTLDWQGSDFCYIQEYYDKGINQVIRILDRVYIPLLANLGFKEEVEFNNREKKTEMS